MSRVRYCSKCNKSDRQTEFYPSKTGYCVPCAKAYGKTWRRKNKREPFAHVAIPDGLYAEAKAVQVLQHRLHFNDVVKEAVRQYIKWTNVN